MEKLARYRQTIQQILLDYAGHKPAYGNIEVETIWLFSTCYAKLLAM